MLILTRFACLALSLVAGLASRTGEAAIIVSRDGNVDGSYNTTGAGDSAFPGRGLFPISSADGRDDAVLSILLNGDHSLLLVGEGTNQSQPVGGVLNIDPNGKPVAGAFCHASIILSCMLTNGFHVANAVVPGIASPYARDLFLVGTHPLTDTTSDIGFQLVSPSFNSTTPTIVASDAAQPHSTPAVTVTAFGQQPDAKFLIVGYETTGSLNTVIFVTRAMPDGTVDTSFGNGGTTIIASTLLTTDGGHGDYEANAFALAPDGKIVIVGTVTSDTIKFNRYVGVFRLLPNGLLDTSFNSTGRVSLDFAGGDFVQQQSAGNAVALRDDGSIIVGGSVYAPVQTGNSDTQQYAAVARILSDGSVGTPFGVNNVFLSTDNSYAIQASSSIVFHYQATGDLFDSVNAVSIQPNGRILLAGGAAAGTRSNYFGISRLQKNGDADFSFGGATSESTRIYSYLCGSTTCASAPNDTANAIVSDSNGIYVAGASRGSTGHKEFGYTRLINHDAVFANSFGNLPPGG